MYLRDTGSKFWPKFFNDNGRSAEKNAETPVTGVFFRNLAVVTGISRKISSNYSRFFANFSP